MCDVGIGRRRGLRWTIVLLHHQVHVFRSVALCLTLCHQSCIHADLRLDPSAVEESNMFVAVSADRTEGSGPVDLDFPKCAGIQGGMMVAYMPSIGQITRIAQVGSWEKDLVAVVRYTR
jgi:hypothetical protein